MKEFDKTTADLDDIDYLDHWLPEFLRRKDLSEKAGVNPHSIPDRKHWSIGASVSNSSFTSGWMDSMETKYLGPLVENEPEPFPALNSGSFPSSQLIGSCGPDAWCGTSPIASFIGATVTGSAIRTKKRGREPSIQSHRSSGRLSFSIGHLDDFPKDDSFLVRSSHRSSGFLGVDTVLAELSAETMPPGVFTKPALAGSCVGLPLASNHNDNVLVCVGEADRIDNLNVKVTEMWNAIPSIPHSQVVDETVHEDIIVEDPKPMSNKGIPLALRQQQIPGEYIVPHSDSPASTVLEPPAIQGNFLVSPNDMGCMHAIRLPERGGGAVVGFVQSENTASDVRVATSNMSIDSSESTAGLSKPKRKIVKHYPNQEEPSKHCHLCSRKPVGQHLICSNYLVRECRKIICKKCFDKNKWDWNHARIESNRNKWKCCHCREKCPRRASCQSYRIKNRLRPAKGKRAKFPELSTAGETVEILPSPTARLTQ